MPSKLMRKLHLDRAASWFEDSKPMTRREFYLLFTLLFALITFALVGLKNLSDGRVQERKRADYRGCVYVREHVVLPDRATVITSPYKTAPLLSKLGFSAKQIEGYLRNSYGGVDPKLLEQPPPDGLGLPHDRAVELTSGPADSVADEVARRPIPNCVDPDAPKPPGVEQAP